MSSSRALTLRHVARAAALALPLLLAGCTGLTPLYGDAGITDQRVAVSYAAPANRLEQVIYQALALRLGKASGEVPTVAVSASSSTRNLTSNTIVHPVTQSQVTVTAAITVTAPDGTVLFRGTRSASADYTQGAQAFASEQAADEAAERAAKALADTIRLQVLAVLSQ